MIVSAGPLTVWGGGTSCIVAWFQPVTAVNACRNAAEGLLLMVMLARTATAELDAAHSVVHVVALDVQEQVADAMRSVLGPWRVLPMLESLL